MGITDLKISLTENKKALKAVMVLGAAGLILIMLSSFGNGDEDKKKPEINGDTVVSEQYREETESRLADFLRSIEGVGEVKVYLTVSGESEYVYATEGKKSIGENKTEEENKYVMIGTNGSKSALIETVNSPEITGAVIACTGADSPLVQEAVYKAVSTALGVSTGKVYVTKLR